jgi:hypothetical protein
MAAVNAGNRGGTTPENIQAVFHLFLFAVPDKIRLRKRKNCRGAY